MCIAQNYGSRWIAAQIHFGGKNIGGLAALHSKHLLLADKIVVD